MTEQQWIWLARALGAFLVLLANSLIIAGTKSPAGASGFWAELLRILGRLSVLRHSDAPGTLHLPLTRQPWPLGRAFAAEGSFTMNGRPVSGVTRVALLLLAPVLALFGCGLLANHPTLMKALGCAGTAISDALLTGLGQELNGAGWASASTSAAEKALGDGLPCALSALESAGPAPAPTTTAAVTLDGAPAQPLEDAAHWVARAKRSCPGEWKHTHPTQKDCTGRPPGHIAAACVLHALGY